MVVTPDQAAIEQAVPLIECALNISVSTPASWKQVHSHLAIVLLESGSCFPTHDKTGYT